MAYNFATSAFRGVIKNTPGIDTEALRASAVKIMEDHDPQAWHTEPIVTTLMGAPLRAEGDREVETVDAFNKVNGKQVLSPPAVVDKLIAHAKEFKVASTDLRTAVRAIEDVFFAGPLAAELVAFQALDFHKQDGITEIEEAVQAIRVERQLSDALYEDEKAAKVTIGRQAAFVGCVSNFTNFLDLCRKIIRNIEIGVPVVVLSRSNTTQHHFRYVNRLLGLMREHKVDLGLCTFCSCSIEEQRRLLAACKGSPMYFTGSRAVASRIKEVMPKLMASTGGPNTMVVAQGKFTPEVASAARMSNMIEHKGQCTALRHLVVAGGTLEDVHTVYKDQPTLPCAAESMRSKEFCATLKGLSRPLQDGYTAISAGTAAEVAIRHCGEHPPKEIDEQWREAYLDLTTPKSLDPDVLQELFVWLNQKQPISLAMNCGYETALDLFENTAIVVYTVGDMSKNKPALTCQARPQEGECFGEFPPRRELEDVTAFPVIIPSSTPGYNSSYCPTFLQSHGAGAVESWGLPPALGACSEILGLCSCALAKGYCRILMEYLADATADGPRRGCGERTALFGLQRPPTRGGQCCIRVSTEGCMDEALQHILPFAVTNARTQLVISVDSSLAASSAVATLQKQSVQVVIESQAAYQASEAKYWNVVSLPRRAAADPQYPLAAHFVSRLFPMGHIKSVSSDDQAFLEAFSASPKWLRLWAKRSGQ